MYFSQLTIGVIIFYLAISSIIGGVITLLVKTISNMLFGKRINIKKTFLWVSVLVFIVFIILIITDEPYEGGRGMNYKTTSANHTY